MKFLKGFLFGAVSGFAVGTNLSTDQRHQLLERVRSVGRCGRGREISDTVRQGADRVAEAATDRLTEELDSVSRSAADAFSSS
jgi:hypothetical protein